MSSRVELRDATPTATTHPMLFACAAHDGPVIGPASALGAASAALRVGCDHQDSRSRICFLLAELASQLRGRSGDLPIELPVSRTELALAAGISLTRTKRILAFLDLSDTVEQNGSVIRLLDWPRLCRLAGDDSGWFGSSPSDDEEESLIDQAPASPAQPVAVTLAGDPASFV